MDEIWKPVVGYEGFYEVSNLGRVKSLDRVVTFRHMDGPPGAVRTRRVAAREILQSLTSDGYPSLRLRREGEQRSHYTHALVAEAFIGPRTPERYCVNHIDADRANNRVENLEWVSHKENTQHAIALGRLDTTPSRTFLDSRNRSVVGVSVTDGVELRFETIKAAVNNFVPGKGANYLWPYIGSGKPRFGHTWSFS